MLRAICFWNPNILITYREETMKTRCTINGSFLGILFLGVLLQCVAPSMSQAQAEFVNSKGSVILAEELDKLKGGWVSITLNSGATFSGTVVKVAKGMVHLSKIQGKEFYEALIRLDDISAIGARFRSKKKK
jgi:hypothetical protein